MQFSLVLLKKQTEFGEADNRATKKLVQTLLSIILKLKKIDTANKIHGKALKHDSYTKYRYRKSEQL